MTAVGPIMNCGKPTIGEETPWSQLDQKKLLVVITVLINSSTVESQELQIIDDLSGPVTSVHCVGKDSSSHGVMVSPSTSTTLLCDFMVSDRSGLQNVIKGISACLSPLSLIHHKTSYGSRKLATSSVNPQHQTEGIWSRSGIQDQFCNQTTFWTRLPKTHHHRMQSIIDCSIYELLLWNFKMLKGTVQHFGKYAYWLSCWELNLLPLSCLC